MKSFLVWLLLTATAFSAPHLTPVRSLKAIPGEVLLLSPDGRFLRLGTVSILEVATGRSLLALQGGHAAFSPDSRLAAVETGGELRLYSTDTWKVLWHRPVRQTTQDPQFSGNSRYVARDTQVFRTGNAASVVLPSGFESSQMSARGHRMLLQFSTRARVYDLETAQPDGAELSFEEFSWLWLSPDGSRVVCRTDRQLLLTASAQVTVGGLVDQVLFAPTGAVVAIWNGGGELSPLFSQVFSAQGTPLTRAISQGDRPAADGEPHPPAPVLAAGGVALAEGDQLIFLDESGRQVAAFAHPWWYGEMAAVQGSWVVTAALGKPCQLLLWSRQGRLQALKLESGLTPTKVQAAGSTVLVADPDQGRLQLFSFKP